MKFWMSSQGCPKQHQTLKSLVALWNMKATVNQLIEACGHRDVGHHDVDLQAAVRQELEKQGLWRPSLR